MSIAILVVAVAILLIALRILWLVQDMHWAQQAAWERLSAVDMDVRYIHGEIVPQGKSPRYPKPLWAKP